MRLQIHACSLAKARQLHCQVLSRFGSLKFRAHILSPGCQWSGPLPDSKSPGWVGVTVIVFTLSPTSRYGRLRVRVCRVCSSLASISWPPAEVLVRGSSCHVTELRRFQIATMVAMSSVDSGNSTRGIPACVHSAKTSAGIESSRAVKSTIRSLWPFCRS